MMLSGCIFRALWAIAPLAFLVWCISAVFKGLGPAPEAVFDALLDDSSEVDSLDGFVRQGDGYTVHIRFRAGDDWIRALPHRGFVEFDCGSAREHIHFSVMRVAAWPLWLPEGVDEPLCFRRAGENKLSPQGRDWILAEEGGGWVYFSGEGREHDRALPSSDKAEFPQDQ
jgi:hypothetical protein